MDRILKANGEILEISPKNGKDYSLEELRDIVDGYIEIVFDKTRESIMVVNEEGKLYNLPFNTNATRWMNDNTYHIDDYVVGDALVCDRNHVK